MSRSYKIKSHAILEGANSTEGKKGTSRKLRHKVKQHIKLKSEDDDFFDIQDKTRGSAGSKDRDSGWKYFGDGRRVYHNKIESK